MKNKLATNLFFWFQLVLSITFGVSQFIHMFHSTQGVSMSMFGFAWIVVAVNLWLTIKAHQTQPSTITLQTVVLYIWGVAAYSGLCIMMLAKGINVWDAKDWLSTILVIISLIPLAIIAVVKGWSITNPMIRGWGTLCLKVMPQSIMAWKVWTVGGSGLAPTMVATFNIITIFRIIQVYLTIRENGLDKNRRALFISEIGNEISWLAVTIAWWFNH